MRSKLIRMRGPTITPIMFLVVMVICCLMIYVSAKLADKWHNESNGDLSLCPFCNQSVQLPSR
jgi:hypothetical protein